MNVNVPWGVILVSLVGISTWGARRKTLAVTTWASHQLSTCVIPCTRQRGRSWRYAENLSCSLYSSFPCHCYYASFWQVPRWNVLCKLLSIFSTYVMCKLLLMSSWFSEVSYKAFDRASISSWSSLFIDFYTVFCFQFSKLFWFLLSTQQKARVCL